MIHSSTLYHSAPLNHHEDASTESVFNLRGWHCDDGGAARWPGPFTEGNASHGPTSVFQYASVGKVIRIKVLKD
jgi:hypothetical protein